MAITTGDFINANRLKTSSGAPSQLNYGGTKIYRAYYGNQLIWDVWRTTLSANDFNIISKGGNVSDYTTVESYYLDALDNKNNLAYTFNPSSIGTRLETTSTTHNVKVTQTATGKSITIKATQAGAVYTASSTITTTQVAAKGGNSTVTVSWTLYKDGELYKTGTSAPTAISGTDVSGDNITCTIDGVTVKVPSAGKTTYSNARTVFNVMSWTFVADGKTFTGSGKVAVTQKANSYTDAWNTPILNVTPNVTKINSGENPVSLLINSYRTGKRTYTSTSESDLHEDISANITTTLGTLSKKTVSGKEQYSVLTIGDNDSDKARTATVTVSTGGYTATATITQSGRTHSSTSYNTPTVKSTSIGGTIPASGGTVWLTVNWSQTQTLHYDNGTTSSSTITGSSTATVTGGIEGGGSINGGGVYAPSLGTTIVAAKTVYTITSYSFIANGKTGTGTGSIVVNQAENKVTNTTSGSYNLSISANSTAAMANSGGTRTITVGCTQNKTDKYSSGSTKDYTTNATATVKTSHGYFGSSTSTTSTTVTGSGSLTLHVLENLGSARTVTVTATVSSTSKTVSFTQNAMSYVFTSTSATSISVNASATTLTLTGTSTINGYQQSIAKGNVSLSSGLTLSSVTTTNGTYTLVLSVPANYSTSSRTFTATITQPKSGATIKYTITQAGKPQDVTTIYWVTGSGTWRTIAGGVSATAKLEYSSSLTGNVTVTLIVDGSTRSNRSFALSSGTTSGTKKQLSVNISSKTTYAPDSVVQLKFSYGNQSGTITCSQ